MEGLGPGALDEAQEEEQYNCSDGGDDDAAYEATAERDSKSTEQEPAEERTNHANHEIANEAEPATLDEHTRQPACYEPDDEKPEQTHFMSPRFGLAAFERAA